MTLAIAVKYIIIATIFQVLEKRTLRNTIMNLSMRIFKKSSILIPVEINCSSFLSLSPLNVIVLLSLINIILVTITSNEIIIIYTVHNSKIFFPKQYLLYKRIFLYKCNVE